MQGFPHHYTVSVSEEQSGRLSITSDGLPALSAAPPAEFDGPGDQWSPETLLLSSAASCLALSFTAVAKASKFDWTSLECEAVGTLDRIDRVTSFTQLDYHVTLVLPDITQADRAEKLLHKAESVCLISNSLNARIELVTSIKEG